jgi:hypothetical protein
MMKTDQREQIPGRKRLARSLPVCPVSVSFIDLPGAIILCLMGFWRMAERAFSWLQVAMP